MGKTQSKSLGLYRKKDCPEGECFVVNAHFNPLALSDFDETFKPTKTDSEITLSLSSCTKDTVFINRAGFADDKYPLKVVLPPESCLSSTCCIKEALEKLDNETSVDAEETKDVTFQGLECDVSVQANVGGNEKQEFLFTLYDLDGYGKITKDDVASLVKNIYEAMGSSLKLPPSGSKTIKVKLTVAPDRKMKEEEEKQASDKVCSEKEAKQSAEDERERDEEEEDADADVEDDEEEEVAESSPYPIPPSQNHHHRTPDRPRRSSQIFSSPNNARYASHYHHVLSSSSRPLTSSSRQPQQQHSSCTVDEPQQTSQIRNGSPSPGRKRNKVSFSSPSKLFQKNQLLEIIQANLEKNSFGGNVELSKKRTVDHGEVEEKQRHHHKWRQHPVDENYKDGRSQYLDLAGLENYANLLDRKCDEVSSVDNSPSRCHGGGGACPYEAMDSNHVCSKAARERAHHACHKTRPHHHSHHRSRSHDLADLGRNFRYHLLPDDGEARSYPNHLRIEDIFKNERGPSEKFDWLNGSHHHRNRDIHAALYHARSKSYDAYYCEEAPVSFSPKSKMRSSKVETGEANAGSPHHHKHRNREKEHQRAMQQVASWIEKEHLGLRGTVLPPRADPAQQQQRSQYHHHHHHHHHPNQPQPPQQPTTPKSPERAPLLVERHEHHHIHEHYHHHYHHYHEL